MGIMKITQKWFYQKSHRGSMDNFTVTLDLPNNRIIEENNELRNQQPDHYVVVWQYM